MGCTCSRDPSTTAPSPGAPQGANVVANHTRPAGRVAATPARGDSAKPREQQHAASFDAVFSLSGRGAPAAVVAAADSGGTNPLVGAPSSATAIHPDAALDSVVLVASDPAAVRLTQRHRSITVVTGCGRGYELPEPPLAEHLGRMERRAAIAITVHGLTADIDQFMPDRVPAEVLAASTARCAEWLTEVRRTETMVGDVA